MTRPWPRAWNGGPAQPRGEPALVLVIDVETRGESNTRGDWKAIKRKQAQDEAMLHALFGRRPPAGPWCVRMTRLAPLVLDDDNLAGAFKRIRDRLAEWIGVNDRAPDVAFTVAQEKRKGPLLGVRIEIWGGSSCA
jgi:hypothetical protein